MRAPRIAQGSKCRPPRRALRGGGGGGLPCPRTPSWRAGNKPPFHSRQGSLTCFQQPSSFGHLDPATPGLGAHGSASDGATREASSQTRQSAAVASAEASPHPPGRPAWPRGDRGCHLAGAPRRRRGCRERARAEGAPGAAAARRGVEAEDSRANFSTSCVALDKLPASMNQTFPGKTGIIRLLRSGSSENARPGEWRTRPPPGHPQGASAPHLTLVQPSLELTRFPQKREEEEAPRKASKAGIRTEQQDPFLGIVNPEL